MVMRFPVISAAFMAASIGIGSLLGVATPASAQLSNSNLKDNLDYTGNRVLVTNDHHTGFLVSDNRYDRYERRGDRYDRRYDRYDRRGDRYDRQYNRYDRRGDRYDRRGDRYDRRGDRYDRRYDRYDRRYNR